MMSNILAAMLALLGAPGADDARKANDMREIMGLAAVTPAPDRAYLLFRIPTSNSRFRPVLLRRPGAAEQEAYERAREAAFQQAKAKGKATDESDFQFEYKGSRNFYYPTANFYSKGEEERTLLLSLPPGQYILAGAWNWGFHCLCMGTVGFTAEPGVITDMGTFLTDTVERGEGPSPFPEINAVTQGREKYLVDGVYIAAALRPPVKDAAMPGPLAGLPRKQAEYRVVGKLPNYFATYVTRLAPVAGLLDYREDKVIDVRSGTDVTETIWEGAASQ